MAIEQTSLWAPLPVTARARPSRLAYDAKSDRVAYCSGKSVFLRSVADPAQCVQFTGHNHSTTVASFAPSGFYVASGDEAGNVKVWDAVGEEHLVKGEYQIINGPINDIAWDADSQRLIAVGDGKERYGHAFTWDSGNTVGEIAGHSAQINAVAIKPSRPYRAATVSDDGAMVFYHGPPFRFNSSVRGNHTNFVRDVSYSPDGAFIVSVGADRKIVVYDGKSGEVVKTLGDGVVNGGIFAVSWVDNEKFVTSSADSAVRVWNVATGELVKQWALENKLDNQQVGVVAAGKFIVSLSFNGNLNYFTEDSDEPVRVVYGHQKSITASTITDGYLFSGSYDGRIVRWDLQSGVSNDERSHKNLVVGLLSSKDQAVYSVGWDDVVQSLDGKVSISLDSQPKQSAVYKDKIVVITTNDELILIQDGKVAVTKKLSAAPTAVGISKDKIAVGFQDYSIKLFDCSSCEEIGSLQSVRAVPSYVSFSPNNELVAVGDNSGKIVLYSAETKEVVTSRWSFHTGKINSISWNKDNNQVVSGSLDTNIIVYSVDKPSKNTKFANAHKDGVNVVEWISETEIVTGGNDATIKKWVLK